jgi:hypothetical protein
VADIEHSNVRVIWGDDTGISNPSCYSYATGGEFGKTTWRPQRVSICAGCTASRNSSATWRTVHSTDVDCYRPDGRSSPGIA